MNGLNFESLSYAKNVVGSTITSIKFSKSKSKSTGCFSLERKMKSWPTWLFRGVRLSPKERRNCDQLGFYVEVVSASKEIWNLDQLGFYVEVVSALKERRNRDQFGLNLEAILTVKWTNSKSNLAVFSALNFWTILVPSWRLFQPRNFWQSRSEDTQRHTRGPFAICSHFLYQLGGSFNPEISGEMRMLSTLLDLFEATNF